MRMFPIQNADNIPWKHAEVAYKTYSSLFGNGQTLERLAERGGFGIDEFSCLYLGHSPLRCKHFDDCRERVTTIVKGYIHSVNEGLPE